MKIEGIMDIKIVPTFESAKKYLLTAEKETTNIQHLWQTHMIEPYWNDISRWAPFDQSSKKPPCVVELSALKVQLSILSNMPLKEIKSKFISIVNALPPEDDEGLMSVYLYPACDSDKTLKERQDGVVGTVVFGNIVIRINPLANNFLKWIPFVFAHEYNHNVWGYHHFVLNSGKDCDGSFLEYMITEGQADLFAESLFPELAPKWNRPFDDETTALLWKRIKPILVSTNNQIHAKYMFGDKNEGLPWCLGYSFGRMIVDDFLKKHSSISFKDLISVPARQILKETKFCCDTGE